MAGVRSALAPFSKWLMMGGALLTFGAHVSLIRYSGGDAPPMTLALLAVGIGVFALGVFASATMQRVEDPLGGVRLPSAFLPMRSAPLRVGAALIGGIALALLSARMLAGQTAGWNLLLWFAALGAFLALFASRPRLPRRVSRERCLDILIVLALTALFVGLNARDLNHWYYSAIGDEYAHFTLARTVAQEGIQRPFSQEGVYNHHPYMVSIYQSVFMWMFEANNFWWRFTSVLSGALAIPGMYIAGYMLGGRRAAIAAAALLAFSHYMFAFSHGGFAHLDSLQVTVWAVALLLLGMRRNSRMLLYAAGAAAGYGLYTHYSGRIAGPVVLLFALTVVQPRDWRSLWPLALGIATAALPTFLLERDELFTRMLGQVVGGYDESISGAAGERIVNNIVNNGAAFSHNPLSHTYVAGGLLDPISAYIAALGIGFALGRIGAPSARLLLIWFAVAFTVVGVLNPHSSVAITRMYSVLPPLLLMGGMLAARLLDGLLPLGKDGAADRARLLQTAGAMALVGALILALNIRQFAFETPKVYHTTQEALAMGALQTHPACVGGRLEDAVMVAENTESLLRFVLEARYPNPALPLRIEHRHILDGTAAAVESPSCVIYLHPGQDAAQAFKADMERRYPSGEYAAFSGYFGGPEVDIFIPNAR